MENSWGKSGIVHFQMLALVHLQTRVLLEGLTELAISGVVGDHRSTVHAMFLLAKYFPHGKTP